VKEKKWGRKTSKNWLAQGDDAMTNGKVKGIGGTKKSFPESPRGEETVGEELKKGEEV